jgi:hypothetical protein
MSASVLSVLEKRNEQTLEALKEQATQPHAPKTVHCMVLMRACRGQLILEMLYYK